MPILNQGEVSLKPIDTFISEKIEVTTKEGDTVDTAKIVHLVTKEVPEYIGTIGQLKNDINNLEMEKAGLQKAIDNLNIEIQNKLDLIAKYQPESQAKINSK